MSAALTAADVLRRVRDDLARWAQDAGARVALAADPLESLELLAANPDGLLVAVHWEGEEPVDEQPDGLLATTHRVAVSVAAPMPPTREANAGLIRSTPERAALLDRVAGVRDRARGLRIGGALPRYAGCEPIEIEGHPLAAYRMRFEWDLPASEVEARDVIE